MCWKVTKAMERSSSTEVHCAGLLLPAPMTRTSTRTRQSLSIYSERLTQAQELLEPLQPCQQIRRKPPDHLQHRRKPRD